MSEPGWPKSRANASGNTTRSQSRGASRSSAARLASGRRPDASWTRATRRLATVRDCHMTFCAVVLAGGRASRLDGADKASIEYQGRTLLEHALEALADAAEVVVV